MNELTTALSTLDAFDFLSLALLGLIGAYFLREWWR